MNSAELRRIAELDLHVNRLLDDKAEMRDEQLRLNGELIKLRGTFLACEMYLTRVAFQGAKAVKQLERGLTYNTIKTAFITAGGTMPEIVEPKPIEHNQEITI
ncbi:hypothetical protein LCGC14_0416070 [marine sediment metagenome]|uniref:Uncharacterized protein n=1 Tax=marine sediment metagenome TaxID=412755 RepID=A0A0F9VEH1_9ZZZZ